MNRLHDAAFDRWLITFDEAFRLVVGRQIRETSTVDELTRGFLAFEGKLLRPAGRYPVNPALLERHRERFTRTNG